MDVPGEGGQQAAARTQLQGTATWRQGQWRVTVTAPGSREWVYEVIGSGSRPSAGWLAGTPWAIYPGSVWDEQPEGRWTVPVFWDSGEAPEGNGSLTVR